MRATIFRLVGASVAAAIAAACADAPEPSHGPAASLGLPCADVSGCPPGHRCVRIEGVGSETQGFCTIPCSFGDTATCAQGFAGPGEPRCILAMPPPDDSACLIRCDTPGATGQCPEGLRCAAAPFGIENVCVPPR